MLRSIIGENDQISSAFANRPNAPASRRHQQFTGSAQYSWCNTAGIASAAPPAIAATGPNQNPQQNRRLKRNIRRQKVRHRHPHPDAQRQRHADDRHQPRVCRGVRCGTSSRFLNVFDRASELDTAAATPSSTSSVIRISLGSVCVTPLLYAPCRSSPAVNRHPHDPIHSTQSNALCSTRTV